MLAKVLSAIVVGIEGRLVQVEVDLATGLPSFDIVGLPDAAVRESRGRVRAALRNAGYPLPVRRITVNLAPANVRKVGPSFDLPIAIAILAAVGEVPKSEIAASVVCGELSLDGSVRPVPGVLCMATAAKTAGAASILVPASNGPEAGLLGGLPVIPLDSLRQTVDHLRGERVISAHPAVPHRQPVVRSSGDMAEVAGQYAGKRALEIAAAGGHNVMLVGPPGAGKTMLARRLPGVLPDLSHREALEVTRIYSAAGLLPASEGLVGRRPFRSPHHTATVAGMLGGGAGLRPGEVTLAHHGVLFLDEFAEFRAGVLEGLRQPLEDGQITLSRIPHACTYPARFMLVAATNPCPCGYRGDPHRKCTCTEQHLRRYLSRLSGPMADRIDLTVTVRRLGKDEVWDESSREDSERVRARVVAARGRQADRLAGRDAVCNAQLLGRDLKDLCKVGEEGRRLLGRAVGAGGLSARGVDRVLRVAHTIADLADRDEITDADLYEALHFRPEGAGAAQVGLPPGP